MSNDWRVHRDRDVTAYLIGLREQGVAIRRAIARLAKQGIPVDATETGEPNTWLWMEADHWIVCVVEETEKAIYVTVIKPAG